MAGTGQIGVPARFKTNSVWEASAGVRAAVPVLINTHHGLKAIDVERWAVMLVERRDWRGQAGWQDH